MLHRIIPESLKLFVLVVSLQILWLENVKVWKLYKIIPRSEKILNYRKCILQNCTRDLNYQRLYNFRE